MCAQVHGLSQTMEVVRSDLHRTHLEVADLIRKERRESASRRRRSIITTSKPLSSSFRTSSGSGSASERDDGRDSVSPSRGAVSSPMARQGVTVDPAAYGSFVARAATKLRPASPSTSIRERGSLDKDKRTSRRISVAVVDASLVYEDGTTHPADTINPPARRATTLRVGEA